MKTRRSFLAGSAAVAAATHPLVRLAAQTVTGAPVTISIDSSKHLATVPEDFTGLSYESAQLGHPEFFSAQNKTLIGLFRALGKQGVLRIGGNTGEYTTWSSNDADAAKNHTPPAMGPDAGTAAKTASIITPVAIRNLREFIDAVGWRIIYGLNLWHGTPENAAAEAKYVASTLGDRLITLQIGNEPDMDHDPGSRERWTFDHYWDRWTAHRDAVKAAVPNARFAAPDIAKEYDWLIKTAEKKPDLEFLSGHYYAEGPPADPRMTLEFLLHRGRNPATQEFAAVREATKILGRPYRMTEGNSCFHGGKPLVSDSFASALWSGDYWLQLAEAGYIGLNLHGGGNGLYTPIAGTVQNGFTARPVYYGMLLAENFAGATMTATAVSAQSEAQNVTAFSALHHGRVKLAIFNKAANAATVTFEGAKTAHKGKLFWLQAPRIDSKEGVTFGASAVGSAGESYPKEQQTIAFRHGAATLNMPPYSAAYIEA
ncbi:MAG TPA: hypothetical protein VFW30_10855 [Bryocella sp.]|nr:hypothetical protein [Bryocella sp.]